MQTLRIAALAGAAALTPALLAQWSVDPSVNLAVADAPGDQVQAKVRAAADGSVYISWFDNQTGGYDVRVQRLDAGGVEQWPHGGLLVADRSYSSTVDYDLRTLPGGGAVVAFNDDRVNTDQISVVMVSAAGQAQWTTRVSTGSAFKANPRLCVLSDGAIAVGWTEGSGYKLQRVSAAGEPLLASPVTFTESGRNITLADMAPGLDGSVLVSYVRPTGTTFGAPKHIYAQNWTAAGVAGWAAPRIVFDGGSLQFGNFPPIVGDGAGGAVFAWYNTGGTRPALVQRLRADGTEVFPHNGVALSTSAQIHLDPSAAFDPATGTIYACWTVANSQQSQWGWRAQAVTAAGARAWTDSGVELLPLSTNQNSFPRAVFDGQGLVASCFDARSAVAGVVLAAGLDASGAPRWSPTVLQACSVVSGKSRLDTAWTGSTTVLAWGDARADGGDITAQNVNPDGTFGPLPPSCRADFNGDGFLDFFDYDDYVGCFETGVCPPGTTADFNGDDFVDFFDYDDFVNAFQQGC